MIWWTSRMNPMRTTRITCTIQSSKQWKQTLQTITRCYAEEVFSATMKKSYRLKLRGKTQVDTLGFVMQTSKVVMRMSLKTSLTTTQSTRIACGSYRRMSTTCLHTSPKNTALQAMSKNLKNYSFNSIANDKSSS
eukprot:PhF_6_TR7829/c0_g1_i1/m.11319